MTFAADLIFSFRSPCSSSAIESDAETLDAEIAANRRVLEEAVHWRVSTLVFNGEPFFEQDRIAMVTWRMEQSGVAQR